MASENVAIRRSSAVYLIVAAAAAISIMAAAWWNSRAITEDEARRIARIQLRMLGTARERLDEYLHGIDTKIGLLANSPLPSATASADGRLALNQLYQNLNLEPQQLRLYGPDGQLTLEEPAGVQRVARLSEDKIQELLEWSKQKGNQQIRLLELEDLSIGKDPPSRGAVRVVAPIWTNDKDGQQRPNGFVALWFSTSSLFESYMIPTQLLPESYAFVLYWQASPDNPGAGDASRAPALLWHSTERQWVGSRAGDVGEFLGALRDGTIMLHEVRDDWETVQLPRRDGRNRREVLAFVYKVFGTQRLILCLSTPYDVVVGQSIDQSRLMLLLGLLTLGLLLVGAGLFYYQRAQANRQQVERLREMESHYRELFAENPTATMVINDEARFVDCNYSAERLLDLSRQEAIGTSLYEVFEDDSIQPIWEALRQHGHLYGRDARLVRLSDQAVLLVEIWGRRIGQNWVVLAHDVEQRRDLEQQIARLKRMDSMGSLASTIAHDFNNILGQVQILVSNLRSDAPEDSSTYEDLGAIEEKVEDAAQLVANLLAFRETVVADEPVWLEPVLREFVTNQKKVLPSTIELTLDFRREIPSVWITAHSLRRVLSNLCLNACDAMPYGGTLSIRCFPRRVEPLQATDQLPADNYAVIEVFDTGSGMSPEVLDTIFEPFFTTKGEEKGTGLGLWTVYKIVRRAGGWVHVHSRKGKGTRFTIYLPHSRPQPENTSPWPQPATAP